MGRQWVLLRPDCVEFLDALFARFQVGIWSTALHKNVMEIIRCLEIYTKKKYPFFMIWGQEQCHTHSTKTIFRPDKMGVVAKFKPLKYVWNQYGNVCECSKTILIDDSPYKGCTNPIENCIFPKAFDVNHEDSILIEELLPYLIHLNESKDAREVIKFDRYGQEPIQYGHELYAQFRIVIVEWNKLDHAYASNSLSVESKSINGKDTWYIQASITSCFKRPSST